MTNVIRPPMMGCLWCKNLFLIPRAWLQDPSTRLPCPRCGSPCDAASSLVEVGAVYESVANAPVRPELEDVRLALRAIGLGCRPKWHDGIVGWAFHCMCEDGDHAHDQQCSAISPQSLDRAAARPRR